MFLFPSNLAVHWLSVLTLQCETDPAGIPSCITLCFHINVRARQLLYVVSMAVHTELYNYKEYSFKIVLNQVDGFMYRLHFFIVLHMRPLLNFSHHGQHSSLRIQSTGQEKKFLWVQHDWKTS